MTDARQPWAQWISDEIITALYAEGIKRWGGAGSAPQRGCVDGALGAAYNAEQYSPETEEGGGILPGLIFCGYRFFTSPRSTAIWMATSASRGPAQLSSF